MITTIAYMICFLLGLAVGLCYMDSIYKKDIEDLTDQITEYKKELHGK
jgi:hypothetical protein